MKFLVQLYSIGSAHVHVHVHVHNILELTSNCKAPRYFIHEFQLWLITPVLVQKTFGHHKGSKYSRKMVSPIYR